MRVFYSLQFCIVVLRYIKYWVKDKILSWSR